MPNFIKSPTTPVYNVYSGNVFQYPIVLNSSYQQTIQHNLNTKVLNITARVTISSKEVFISPNFYCDTTDPTNKVIVEFDQSYVGFIMITAGGVASTEIVYSPFATYPTSTDLTITDDFAYSNVVCTTSGQVITVNLPTVADNFGKEYTISKVDVGSGIVYVTPEAGETIDEYSTPYHLRYNNETLIVKSIGNRWLVKEYKGKEKTYWLGNTYNGVLLDLTPSGFTIGNKIGYCKIFKDLLSNYFMEFNFGIFPTAGITACIVDVSGITFKPTGIVGETLWAIYGGNGTGAATIQYAVENTSRLQINGNSRQDYVIGGTVPLALQPTWCDNI